METLTKYAVFDGFLNKNQGKLDSNTTKIGSSNTAKRGDICVQKLWRKQSVNLRITWGKNSQIFAKICDQAN